MRHLYFGMQERSGRIIWPVEADETAHLGLPKTAKQFQKQTDTQV